ncbi:MAG: hypothetical protein H7840_16195 [Alphaproteobacteria bacterium]
MTAGLRRFTLVGVMVLCLGGCIPTAIALWATMSAEEDGVADPTPPLSDTAAPPPTAR